MNQSAISTRSRFSKHKIIRLSLFVVFFRFFFFIVPQIYFIYFLLISRSNYGTTPKMLRVTFTDFHLVFA